MITLCSQHTRLYKSSSAVIDLSPMSTLTVKSLLLCLVPIFSIQCGGDGAPPDGVGGNNGSLDASGVSIQDAALTDVRPDGTILDAAIVPPQDVRPSQDTTPLPQACNQTLCGSLAGNYTGTYRVYTDERLGSSIINSMECMGTSSITIDFAKAKAFVGTLKCNYTGGLTLFSKSQTATIEAAPTEDGRFKGNIVHRFGSFSDTQRTFAIVGKIQDGTLSIETRTSWSPHAMSAVPWGVDLTVNAPKQP